MNHDPAKQAWQSSVETPGLPPLEQVRRGADKFYRFVKWRNVTEYAACVIAIVGFSANVIILPHVLQKMGSVMIVVAVLFVAYQLHRRASAVAPENAGTMPLLRFSRAQLVRHRDALRSMASWYLLPFVPGLLVMTFGVAGQQAGETTAIVMPDGRQWMVLAGIGALFVGIWWFNQRVVRKLQRNVDEIDALLGGEE